MYAVPMEYGEETVLVCTNRPGCPGELKAIACPLACCRNFCAKRRSYERTDPAQMPAPADPSIRHIPLTRGKFTMVDAADFEWLSQYRWSACGVGENLYARAFHEGKHLLMHRLIMNPPPGMVVDHKDGNRLHNRRCNLRNCTPQQNQLNTRPHRKTKQFKGVSPCGDKWQARIGYRGEQFFLGVFDDPVEAAKARDRKAVELYGEYAWLNFPEEAARYKSEIADSRSQIPNCGLKADAGGKPQPGGPSTAGDAESRVTTVHRSRRGSKRQPSPRPAALTLPCGYSYSFTAARLAGRTLCRDEACTTGRNLPEMTSTSETARPAPWWHGPRVYLPFWWPPLTARGPPERQVGAGFKPAPTEDTNYGLVSRMSSM